MNQLLTDEEKAAKKIIDALSDLRLDLDYLGSYLRQLSSTEIADRIRRVTEPFRENQKKENKMNANEPEPTAGIISKAPPADTTSPIAILFLYPR